MNRIKLNYFVDILLLIAFFLVGFSAFMGYAWYNIHKNAGIAFILLIIVHLILHWKTIKNIPKALLTKKQA